MTGRVDHEIFIFRFRKYCNRFLGKFNCSQQSKGSGNNSFDKSRKIGIYSFAIWDDKDKETFKTMLFADITKTYNINIDLELLFSVPDIIKISGFDPKMKPNEFIKSYGKELSFIQFSKKKFGGNGNETFLIDDLVEDTYIESKNIKITMLNPIRVDKNYQPSTLALSLPNVSVSQSG